MHAEILILSSRNALSTHPLPLPGPIPSDSLDECSPPTIHVRLHTHSPCAHEPQSSLNLVSRSTNTVNLRIEGQNNTIFEGPIRSGPRNITLPTVEGPNISYPCNGLNNNANPTPGNTPTDALDAASKAYGFTYSGEFDDINKDLYIDNISTSSTRTATNVAWAVLVNYIIPDSPAGFSTEGCETECGAGDDVLWAFVTYEPITTTREDFVFLKLAPTALTVGKGESFVVAVTDARTGAKVMNAVVGGVRTDEEGRARLTVAERGVHRFKAMLAPPSVRSNGLTVTVR